MINIFLIMIMITFICELCYRLFGIYKNEYPRVVHNTKLDDIINCIFYIGIIIYIFKLF